IIFFHGGGWVAGNLESHDAICRRFADSGRCCVLSVDYRLAPEHRFPAAFDDALASVQWASNVAPQYGVDPRRLVVAGDSAGGNLAAAVCLAARDRGGPPI